MRGYKIALLGGRTNAVVAVPSCLVVSVVNVTSAELPGSYTFSCISAPIAARHDYANP